MDTKLDQMVTALSGSYSELFDPLVMWSCEITWQTKTIISALPYILAAKLGRVVIFYEGLPS